MDAISLFLGLVVAGIIIGILVILSYTPRGQNTSDSKETIEGTNFIPSQMFMGTDGLSGLAVNERTRKICLLKSPSSAPLLLPITDLIGSYFIKNGESEGEEKRSFPKEIVTFSNELHRKKMRSSRAYTWTRLPCVPTCSHTHVAWDNIDCRALHRG